MNDETVLAELLRLEIETPSWGYGNSGTRFHVYPWPGAARTVSERIDDAALVHRLTGVCPSVAIHIPWDRVDDWGALKAHAEDQGIRIGAINPNLFGQDEYRLGSICNPDPAVRRRALDHCLECIEIAQEVGSTIISLWLADGTNYPGQDALRSRYARLTDSLEELYAALPSGMRLLDESHNVEGKIDAMIQSVMNIQTAYAKALLVDAQRLVEAQTVGDVLGAHRIYTDAFETDVRPLLTRLREELGVSPDPVEAFRVGGYADKRAADRGSTAVESAYERS